MTQNARVARWIPTVDPDEIGDGIVTTNPPTANKTIDTKFLLGGGGGGGGVPEAPSDGVQYGRKDAAWTPVIAGAGPATGVTVTPGGGISSINVQTALLELDAEKVAKGGDVMTGHLSLPTSPAADQAVRKDYVDSADGTLAGSLAGKVNKGGDTMTGHLSLPTGPVAANAVRKDYVDAAITAIDLTPYAPKANPIFTGDPRAPTPAAADNDTSIATTAFVQGELAAKAPLASPTFTGDPKAPTPTAGDNDTSIATTAFVKNAVDTAAVPPATVAPLMDGAAAVGAVAKYAREDHVHPTDTSRAAASAIPVTATAAEYISNSAPTKMLTPNAVWNAAVPITLTDAATVTPDFSLGLDFQWTIAAVGRSLANPTNIKQGQKGILVIIQDGTGSRTITSWGSYWLFPGGTKPTLSTAPNSRDVISFWFVNGVGLLCTFSKGFG